MQQVFLNIFFVKYLLKIWVLSTLMSFVTLAKGANMLFQINKKAITSGISCHGSNEHFYQCIDKRVIFDKNPL